MGTIRRLTDLQLGSIATTKVLVLTGSETVFTINSGNRGFEATNWGPSIVVYGQSSVLATSGGQIASGGGAKFWDTIIDNFTMYFASGSGGATATLVIQEYGGNNVT